MPRYLRLPSLFVATMLLLIVAPAPRPFTAPSGLPDGVAVASPPSAETIARVDQTFGQLPLYFIENVGQFAAGARFQVRGSDRTIWLAQDAIWVTVLERPRSSAGTPAEDRSSPRSEAEMDRGPDQAHGVDVRLSFVGANPSRAWSPWAGWTRTSPISSAATPPGGTPTCPPWGGVRYVDLYPGVDMENQW